MFYYNYIKVHQTRERMFLADPAEARGCSTNTEAETLTLIQQFEIT